MSDTKNINTRFPLDLHSQIVMAANRERRSINAQILALIERGLSSAPATPSTPSVEVDAETMARLEKVAALRPCTVRELVADLAEQAAYDSLGTADLD